MSHWTTIKTKLNDQGILKGALERMGFKVQEGNFSITQYKTTGTAQLKLDDAVGLSRQEDGSFAMIGDFWHSPNSAVRAYYGRGDKFAKDITNAYGIEQTVQHLEGMEFQCIENEEAEIGEDGLITMTFEKLS